MLECFLSNVWMFSIGLLLDWCLKDSPLNWFLKKFVLKPNNVFQCEPSMRLLHYARILLNIPRNGSVHHQMNTKFQLERLQTSLCVFSYDEISFHGLKKSYHSLNTESACSNASTHAHSYPILYETSSDKNCKPSSLQAPPYLLFDVFDSYWQLKHLQANELKLQLQTASLPI